MKTAIYIEDGITQLVLTPETDWEKRTMDVFRGGDQTVKVMRGGFYECRGGWIRQIVNDDSLILQIDDNAP